MSLVCVRVGGGGGGGGNDKQLPLGTLISTASLFLVPMTFDPHSHSRLS